MSALSLTDAQAYLKITTPDSNGELQATIDAAEMVITQRVGPLASTPVTRRLSSSGGVLVLPVLPAISLTSVTPVGGTALTLADLYLDTATGIVSYADGITPFFGNRYLYTVVYAAGRSPVPADLLQAIKELVRHLWVSQRGAGVTRPGAAVMDPSVPGSAYSLPIRVEQLLAPYQQFGFA